MTFDATTRRAVTDLGRSFFERRLTFGRTGNTSVREGDRAVITPTRASLGDLDPNHLSVIDAWTGAHVDGPEPSKEAFLHAALYRARPSAGSVVHTHSTSSVAVSVLRDTDPSDVLPPLTAYYVMRVGRLPLLPYHPPGDDTLGPAAEAMARDHHAMLIANHGPIVAGADLAAAADALEELEETARLYLLLDGRPTRPLTPEQAEDLHRRYPSA